MKKILYILLITFFSFTIISCAQINTLKDDLGSKYDELSSGSDETVDTDVSEAPAAIAEGSSVTVSASSSDPEDKSSYFEPRSSLSVLI